MAILRQTLTASAAAGMLAGITATSIFYEAATDTETTVMPDPLPIEIIPLAPEVAAPLIEQLAQADAIDVTCSRPAHDPATPHMAGRLFCTDGQGAGFYVEDHVDLGELKALTLRDGKVYVE